MYCFVIQSCLWRWLAVLDYALCRRLAFTLCYLMISYNGFYFCIVNNSEFLSYLFSNKDDTRCHSDTQWYTLPYLALKILKKKPKPNQIKILSIPSFEMKRPLSHEEKCKGNMFDYFWKDNLSSLILLCIVFRQRLSQQKMLLTPSCQLLFISKSYLCLRVVSSFVVPERSAASVGLCKWEFPQFCKLLNSHCSACAFVFACSNCQIK